MLSCLFSYSHLFFQEIAEPIKLSDSQKGIHIKLMHRYSKNANKEEKDMRKSWVNNMLLKRGLSSLSWKESYDKAR